MPSGPRRTTSSSSRYVTRVACPAMAEASEAMKNAPSDCPTSSGDPRRAAMSVCGASGETTAMPNVPRTSCSPRRTDSSRSPVWA